MSKFRNIVENILEESNFFHDERFDDYTLIDKNKLKDSFWEWFGKSVCRDKNGNPIIFYHGTPNMVRRLRGGTYFTANKNYADHYQNPGTSQVPKTTWENPGTYEVFLKIENPFDTRKPKCRKQFYDLYYHKMGSGADLTDTGLPDWTDGRDLIQFLKREHPEFGYDGLFLEEGGVGGNGYEVTYRGMSIIPFSANQIKSVKNCIVNK